MREQGRISLPSSVSFFQSFALRGGGEEWERGGEEEGGGS
jgi:hypothetical protein